MGFRFPCLCALGVALCSFDNIFIWNRVLQLQSNQESRSKVLIDLYFNSNRKPPNPIGFFWTMGLSKIEINLRRLLAAAPQQKHHAKLIHYVGTLREQLEQLAAERTPEGLPRVSKATLSDYSEKIEAIAANLASLELDTVASPELPTADTFVNQKSTKAEEESIPPSPGLRRRIVPLSTFEDRSQNIVDGTDSAPIKLDTAAQTHIAKHRKLQEDLTDEMVGLAQQLKESTLMMNQSIKNTGKILDSTEQAIEHSLASTGRANTQAMAIYSESSKTSCFTWLVMLLMTCMFVMVVLLIKVT